MGLGPRLGHLLRLSRHRSAPVGLRLFQANGFRVLADEAPSLVSMCGAPVMHLLVHKVRSYMSVRCMGSWQGGQLCDRQAASSSDKQVQVTLGVL